MGFQDFLDTNGVKGVDPNFATVMDSVAAPIVIAALVATTPNPALPTTALITAVPLALAQKGGVTDPAMAAIVAAGAALFMTAISTDLDVQIGLKLTAGSVSLKAVPPLGGPGGPVVPTALAAGPSALNPAFGIAVLQWAISLLVPGDPRILPATPFVAPPSP